MNDVGVQLGDYTDLRAAIFLHTKVINQTKLDSRQHIYFLYIKNSLSKIASSRDMK